MMLAWSTCEPPNGYGVTNCSSLSGNALAALVSAKAAAVAVVASEAIDRRVVMICLFATDVPKVATSPPPIGAQELAGSLLRGRRRVAPAALLPCCAADNRSKPAVGPCRLQCLVARKQSSSGHPYTVATLQSCDCRHSRSGILWNIGERD